MAIDPLSAFLLGSCCCLCWPCLLPLCLTLPISPLPIIIIKEPNAFQNGPDAQYIPGSGGAVLNNLRSSLRFFPFNGYDVPGYNGRRYNYLWGNNQLNNQKTND